MPKLKHYEVKIHDILLENPESRDDDNLLFCEYLKNVDMDEYGDIADEIRYKKLATKFKSVERARRKLQEHNHLLRGKAWVKRHMMQDDFIDYAREKNG